MNLGTCSSSFDAIRLWHTRGMLRRVTSSLAVILELAAMTRVADNLNPDYLSGVFYGFFFVELALLLIGLVGTERGYFGPRHHPVNGMFIAFCRVGIIGALLTILVQGTGTGDPLWLAVIGGAAMLTGSMACAVLAISASPWRDLLYSRRFDRERSAAESQLAESDSVSAGDESVHGISR